MSKRISLLSLVALLLCAPVVFADEPAAQPGEPPMDRLYENRLEVESAQFLSINLYNIPIDPDKAADLSQFVIESPDDSAYAPDKTVHPLDSGSRNRAIRVALRKEMLVKGTHVFLHLPRPMQNGYTYRVRIADLGAAAPLPELAPVQFDDRQQINDNIRVNQLGYLPDYAKRAYVGEYLGDLGAMTVAAESFSLVDENGRSVFTGQVTRRGMNDQRVGQIVHELDFTAFNTPGAYRLHVPGVGLSYEFRIGEGALNPLYVNFMRGHYHQRCGHAVDPALSRHHREACHLDDAFIEQRSEATNFTHPKNKPFYPTRFEDGRQQRATGGHHDAGDYGKYTITGATYVFAALHAMAVFPDKFREDQLGLPYSGNGIPDLLEEVKWELDWLEQMQDPEDGGVFGVIKPNTGGYENSLPPQQSHRLFYPKDTVFTAAYAAALAHASQSPTLREHYPEDSERYLQKAVQAWQFLEKNDRFVEYFHYGAVFGDWDERCWAALELYGATGEAKYHDYFLAHFDPQKKRWSWWPLFEAVGHATHRYVAMDSQPRDASMLERSRAAVREACEMHARHAAESPYRLSMPEPSIRHGDYGWFFPGDLAAYDLLMGYALDGRKEYLQTALDNLSYSCGTNPGGYFLQTGLGAKRNIEVVSNPSTFDGIIEPVPGLPLGIGSAGFYWLNQYGKSIGEGTYPADWPLMNRWYDGFNVSTEFTMGPMMRETIAAAFFADLGAQPRSRPQVSIRADHTAGPAPLTVNFSLDVQPTDREIVQVFWDFGDETFSIQPAPTHVFADAGRQYPVAVTVIDADGLSAYHEVTISSTMVDAPFPQAAREPDSQTVLLYHFDGDLKDASGHGLDLQPQPGAERRPFAFADEAPAWMSEPAGSCLVLDGAERFEVTIPTSVLDQPATTPLTIEMMLYLEAFAGWGYEGDPKLLGLHNDWNSALAWRQPTWEKANAPHFGSAIGSEIFAEKFPRDRWCHVRIVYDGQGSAAFFVDGETWGRQEGDIFQPQVNKPLVFTLGPFRGMVDEVIVRTGAEPAAQP